MLLITFEIKGATAREFRESSLSREVIARVHGCRRGSTRAFTRVAVNFYDQMKHLADSTLGSEIHEKDATCDY